MPEPLRILVVSDLHALTTDPSESTRSHYSTSALFEAPEINPLAGVADLVNREKLGVDFLLCPGDIGDRADPVAQKAAWAQLEAIRAAVGARYLVGSAGNHDLDSRRSIIDIDPKGALLGLRPPFPCSSPHPDELRDADRYWARNFLKSTFAEWDLTLLNVNSSAFHGYASDAGIAPDEHERGRISRLTLDGIKERLATSHTCLNVLLTHHHLTRGAYLPDQNSVMIGGDLLIEALKETQRRWLVIHGHLHMPALHYADADPFAPVILSSASVAAKSHPFKGLHPRNQIHHVEIPPPADRSGGGIHGVVKSYTWSFQVGWKPSHGDVFLPHLTGFGYHPDPAEAAESLITAVREAGTASVKWRRVLETRPKFRFMMRRDLEAMLMLSEAKGLRVDKDLDGMPNDLEVR